MNKKEWRQKYRKEKKECRLRAAEHQLKEKINATTFNNLFKPVNLNNSNK